MLKRIGFIFMATLLSGTVGVLIKLIGDNLHFMTLNFYRVFFAFLFLLIVVPLIDKKAFKLKKEDVGGYFMVGLLIAITFSLYTTAFIFSPVNNVVLLNHLSPFFVFILGYFMLQERITKTKVITLFIAVIGLAIINPFNFEGGHIIGNSLAVASAFFYGVLMIGMRKENKTHGIGDVMWFFFFATLLLLPFAFIFGFGFESLFNENVLVYLLPLGLFSTGLAYLYYNLSLQKIGAETASLIKTVITPLVAISLAIVFLGEVVEQRVLIGGALLVLAGVYLEAHTKWLRGKKHKGKQDKRKK